MYFYSDNDVCRCCFVSGKQDRGNLKRIFEEEWGGIIVGLVVSGVLWIVVNSCMILTQKVKKWRRGDRGHQNVMSDPVEMTKLRVDAVGSVG